MENYSSRTYVRKLFVKTVGKVEKGYNLSFEWDEKLEITNIYIHPSSVELMVIMAPKISSGTFEEAAKVHSKMFKILINRWWFWGWWIDDVNECFFQ